MTPRKMYEWRSWLKLCLCLSVLTLAFCAGFPYVDLQYLHPVYPVSAQNRGLQFRSVILALRMYSLHGDGIPHPGDAMKLSWRAVIAQEECGVPEESVAVNWSKPWKQFQGSTLDKCGELYFCRKDKSPFVLAVNGPGTAHDDGFRNLSADSRPFIVLIESAHADFYWLEPRDFDLSKLQASRGLRPGSEFGRGFHVAFSDGSVWYLKRDTPPNILAGLSVHVPLLDRDVELSEFTILKRFQNETTAHPSAR